MAKLHHKAREEIGTFEQRVAEAKAAVAAAAEKRKQDLLAAAKKAKGAKGKKKGKDEPPPEEEEVAPVQVEQEVDKYFLKSSLLRIELPPEPY